MEEQLPLIEGLPKLEVKARPRSKYQQWKLENNYCKATDNQRCKNCKNMVEKEEANKYYKCILLGLSSSHATDIRLSNVCNLFTPKNADCQLCKHLDCNTEGQFVCGLDGDILDHAGIYCSLFEELLEE
ncbi:MAG: hypothetical protein II453_10070 [Alphaproteobacteria bacterium]|nr:hypothetical protein [Alphaproteobacteria bacterium]MBQ3946333.1 hypothetical protein [Alphaproteobacteria bacterium]